MELANQIGKNGPLAVFNDRGRNTAFENFSKERDQTILDDEYVCSKRISSIIGARLRILKPLASSQSCIPDLIGIDSDLAKRADKKRKKKTTNS